MASGGGEHRGGRHHRHAATTYANYTVAMRLNHAAKIVLATTLFVILQLSRR